MFDLAILLFIAKIMQLHYQIGVIAGFLVGALVNYVLTNSWVFSREQVSRVRHGADFSIFVRHGQSN